MKSLTILAGTNSLKESGVTRDVVEIMVHEKFGNAKHDVALLKVKDKFSFSASISAIELQEEEVPIGAKVVISGWGKTSYFAPPSNLLKFNTLRRMSWKYCSTLTDVSLEGILCLGHSSNNGACQVSIAIHSHMHGIL